MVTFDKNDKKLVIPSALGNFGVAGGGTGSGITPQEAAQISSAITEAAIEEYDIEIQVDLEDLSERISGNTENIAELSGATVALKEQVDGLSLSGITADIESLSGQTSANTQNIGALSGVTTALTSSVDSLAGAVTALTEGVENLSGQTTANTQNIEAVSGAVETLSERLTGYTTTDTYTQGIQGVQGQISGLSGGVAELSAFTSGLSFTVSEQAQNLEHLSGATVAVEQAVSGKQDTISAGNGIDITNDTISVKTGEGLGFSGDTLVVSGGTGGGIEKVTELPANPEEGDIVQLYVSGKTVQTIAMEMTNSEKSFESGYQVAVINGNGFECEGYGTLYGKWVYNSGFDVHFRNRRDANYRYFDFDIDPSEIETGPDADTLTETQIPGYYQIWAFENGAWKQIDHEIVFDPEYDGSIADFFWRVYSGVNFIDADYITLRIKDQGNNKREFKPYDFRYYGMDCQATDGRGAEDGRFGQIGIETIRVNNDGYGALVQKEYTARESSIPDIAPVSFGNDGRGGLTFDADNDSFLYDNGTVSTGDTTNYVEDVIDFAYLNSLFNRDGKYSGFRFLINSHVLNVQSNGETHYYTQPSLAKKPIVGYTIGDYTFVWEFTFKYADYILKIDAPDGANIGANIRISRA